MKILFVGSLTEGQTSLMRMNVFKELGYHVVGLSTQVFWDQTFMLSRRLQQSICLGPIIARINRELLEAVKNTKPDVVWAEKQEFIQPETLKEVSGTGCKLIHYTPDPYFTLSWKRTRLADACFPIYDCLITSKKYELDDYRDVNPDVLYMPLGFCDKVHRPVSPKNEVLKQRYASDICSIGGWAPRREAYLETLAYSVDCSLKIWGYCWGHLQDGLWTPRRWWAMHRNSGGERFVIKKSAILSHAVRGGEIYGDEYAWALSGAKINIGFLRKICPDQHTTRTFEIPACGSLLLADRSEEHEEFFREGVEADYFSSKEEMVDKARYYLKNEQVRQSVAARGFRRCQASGYSYRQILKDVLGRILNEGIL